MIKFYCDIETNLADAFMPESDERNFVDWVDDQLFKEAGKLTMVADDIGLEGIIGIRITIDRFFDINHMLTANIEINTDLSEDELEGYDAVFEYLDQVLIPQFIEEFNASCNVTIPVNDREKLDGIRFDGETFYTQCYPYGSDGYRAEPVKGIAVELTNKFEVMF